MSQIKSKSFNVHNKTQIFYDYLINFGEAEYWLSQDFEYSSDLVRAMQKHYKYIDMSYVDLPEVVMALLNESY